MIICSNQIVERVTIEGMETKETNKTLDQIEEFLCATIEKLEPIRTDPVERGRPRILPETYLLTWRIIWPRLLI